MSNGIILIRSCEEKPGVSIERKVYPLVFTPDNLQKFFRAASKFPRIFGEEFSGDFKKFLNIFLHQNDSGEIEGDGIFWVVDDFVGVFYLTDIYHPYDALMHFAFFDKRLRGRDVLVRDMIKYVFETFGFHRLSAEVPMYAGDHVFAFVEKGVKLVKEGRKRKAIVYKGEWFDVNLYGALREEFIS